MDPREGRIQVATDSHASVPNISFSSFDHVSRFARMSHRQLLYAGPTGRAGPAGPSDCAKPASTKGDSHGEPYGSGDVATMTLLYPTHPPQLADGRGTRTPAIHLTLERLQGLRLPS